MKRMSFLVGATIVCTALAIHLARHEPATSGAVSLDSRIAKMLRDHGDNLEASVIIIGHTGEPWYRWQPDTPRPAASSIKSALLLELFAMCSKTLDRPPAAMDSVLGDENYPAIKPFNILGDEKRAALKPFDVVQRQDIRRALSGASVRRIGEIMMGKIAAPNHVYNAAANLSIAILGGPNAATRKIHERDPAFSGIMVRRYMLAPRQVTGDNEATAASLAAVLQRIACRQVAGVDSQVLEAIRQAFLTEPDAHVDKRYVKDGELESDPLTSVRSGWWDTDTGTVVYVVMTVKPNPGSYRRDIAYRRQYETTSELTQCVWEEARRRQSTESLSPR